MTPEERFDRLDDFIVRATIVRNMWVQVANGLEYTCLLAALSPEAGDAENAAACPADVIPHWFALLLPYMNDNGSLEAWPETIRRVATTVRRCHRLLQPSDWRKGEYAVRAAALREAMPFVGAARKPVVDQVINLCDSTARGEPVTVSEWVTSRIVAQAAYCEAHGASVIASDIHNAALVAAYSVAARDGRHSTDLWLAIDVASRSAKTASAEVYAVEAALNATTDDTVSSAATADTASAASATHSPGTNREAFWDRMNTATLDFLNAACDARVWSSQ